MASALKKITLSASRDIPFDKLILSQSNVRRIKAGVSIEELAEDIARRTLLQSLTVRPVLGVYGAETGMYEIPAGGRRYRALELLVKQKRLARTAPVPCVIREGGIAEEDSLAENIQPDPRPTPRSPSASAGSRESARRLFAMSQPIGGTVVDTYLRRRGITTLHATGSLRFHPRCYYRPDEHSPTQTWPAMIAAVTDLNGKLTGVHRTWLSPDGGGKAPIDTPRRAMGDLFGNAVRFGVAGDVMAAGEGIETMLSLRCVLPTLPMVAALSAAHLAAVQLPDTLRRLYIARDDDPAGDGATECLIDRAQQVGIEAMALSPSLGDFNEDLRTLGLDALAAAVRIQISPQDVARFLNPSA